MSKQSQHDLMSRAILLKYAGETINPNPFRQGTPERKRLRARRRNVLPFRK